MKQPGKRIVFILNPTLYSTLEEMRQRKSLHDSLPMFLRYLLQQAAMAYRADNPPPKTHNDDRFSRVLAEEAARARAHAAAQLPGQVTPDVGPTIAACAAFAAKIRRHIDHGDPLELYPLPPGVDAANEQVEMEIENYKFLRAQDPGRWSDNGPDYKP